MSETRKRPVRACTAKTPSRLAPLAPVVERSGTQRKKSLCNQELSPCVAFNPVPVSDEERAQLRSKWELASVINFINTFRPILNMKPFTSEELETALLTCNELLAEVHITLLKGIHPPSRVALRLDNWVTALQKKLKDRWTKVAEPPFPLISAPGTEAVMYKELDSITRLIILRALCEVRLDQEDVRGFMDQSGKKRNSTTFRKERSGATLVGNLYWCESDPVSGYRLYRETLPGKPKEYKGRDASPPPASRWETLATNLEEFQAATEALLSSKFKQEVGLGRRLQHDIIPVLEEIQKRKKKAVRRLQRETNLLEISFQENGATSGRAKRDRKPVNYTFADYDRSINEAIKFTRKPPELANGHGGPINGHYETTRDQHRQRPKEQPFEQEHDEGSSEDHAHGSRPGLPPYLKFFRRRKRSQRHTERDCAESAYTEEDEDLYSDDEIEGEAIYDEEFLRKRKRRRNGYSTPADAEYKHYEEDAEEPELEEAEVLRTSYSEEEAEEQDEEPERVTYLSRSGRRTRKVVVPPVERSGLRRSKRSTRSKVNYKAYEDSEDEQEKEEEEEVEEEEEEEEEQEEQEEQEDGYSKQMANGEKRINTGSLNDVEYSSEMESGSLPSENSDRQEEHGEQEAEEETQNEWSQRNGDGGVDNTEELGRKQLRFLGLDLNQCAPADEWLANSRGMAGNYLDEDVSAPG